jgi:tRNA(adenine34) deaminase
MRSPPLSLRSSIASCAFILVMPNRFPASHRLSRCIKASGPAQGGRDGDDLEMVASFMDMALAEARAAGEAGEVPVGCVVVCDGAVVARAGNRTLTERDPTAHAELVAIRAAAAVLGSERLDGCDLYVTLEPCAMCAGAVAFARIRRLYYGAADPKGGAIENGVKFFASPTCHHRPEVYGGLAEADASALLKEFFQARR